MPYLKQIVAFARENPLYVYMLFAILLGFVLVIGALLITL